MRASRLFLAAALLFILIDIASAATLHGSIYDIELNELNNVVVQVDSEPNQRYVSKDGMYSFDLNPGNYTITARYAPDKLHEYTTTETVSVNDEGDFVYDLFLFPDFDTEDEALLDEPDMISSEDTNIDINGQADGLADGLTIAIIAVVCIIALLVLYFIIGYFRNKEEKEELEEVEKVTSQAKKALKDGMDDTSMRNNTKKSKKKSLYEGVDSTDLQNVIDFISKEGGRTTQKELRKHIPLSEAKISLMISELEHKKVVQKIKKGRGNIIILKRK